MKDDIILYTCEAYSLHLPLLRLFLWNLREIMIGEWAAYTRHDQDLAGVDT